MNVPLLVGASAALMLAVEIWRPGRHWVRVEGWWLRAVLLNAFQVLSVWIAGISWDGWLREAAPWSAESLGSVPGALLGYLAITFVYYGWHRARHEVPFLWRWFHQVHHSPQRLEIITSFYKHPIEIAANSVLSSAILYMLCGLPPEAASLAVLLTGLAELFYHWNVRTPYWLGFLIQRPESHCVHHRAGAHHSNYSDLPLWDALFGTLDNPRNWNDKCGFGDAERHLVEMLKGVDVTRLGRAR